ncbi:unnamed protein product, partial [Trichogramma brassicae]
YSKLCLFDFTLLLVSYCYRNGSNKLGRGATLQSRRVLFFGEGGKSVPKCDRYDAVQECATYASKTRATDVNRELEPRAVLQKSSSVKQEVESVSPSEFRPVAVNASSRYSLFEYSLELRLLMTRISCKYIGVLPRENRVYRDHRVYTNACIHISEMKPSTSATASAALNPTVAACTRSSNYVAEDLLKANKIVILLKTRNENVICLFRESVLSILLNFSLLHAYFVHGGFSSGIRIAGSLYERVCLNTY